MSKERLEELKKKTTGKDYLWVIEYAVEQTERVQELEGEYEYLESIIDIVYFDRAQEMSRAREIDRQNKRYREAMKKIRKLTETDAGTEEQVFIIADDILMDID